MFDLTTKLLKLKKTFNLFFNFYNTILILIDGEQTTDKGIVKSVLKINK